MITFTKDPDATLDYSIDWSAWLDSDVITASAWTLPPELSEAKTSTFTDSVATVWLAGGEVGETYEVRNRITTVLGRIDDRTLQITIAQR